MSFDRRRKIVAAVLAVPSALCVLLAGSNVYNEVWAQWSEKWGWVKMWTGLVHSAFFLVVGAIVLLNFALVLAVCLWWLVNARSRPFPHRAFGVWFVLLLVSALSYFPSSQQYAAMAVVLFGPGSNSQAFQTRAAMGDSAALLGALLFRGADVDKSVGLTCIAARYNSSRVIDRLAEHGSQVNGDCDKMKRSPLHTAVEAKHQRSVEVLLKAGARVDVQDLKGDTPLDIAMKQGNEQMIGILKK